MVSCQAVCDTRQSRALEDGRPIKGFMQRAIDKLRITADHPPMIANRTIVMHLHTISPLAGRVEAVLR